MKQLEEKKPKSLIKFIKLCIVFSALSMGGLEVILFSFESMFLSALGQLQNGFHNINNYFFKDEFLPLNFKAFWSIMLFIYLLISLLQLIKQKKNINKNLNWLDIINTYTENIYLIIFIPFVIFIQSSVMFFSSLIVFLITKRFDMIARLFSFSDGISIFIKIWIVMGILIYALIKNAYKKSLKLSADKQ